MEGWECFTKLTYKCGTWTSAIISSSYFFQQNNSLLEKVISKMPISSLDISLSEAFGCTAILLMDSASSLQLYSDFSLFLPLRPHLFLLKSFIESESEVAQSCLTRCDPVDCSLPRLLHPWGSPGKNTGVGCHFLLQIFPAQGSNPGLLHCRQIL